MGLMERLSTDDLAPVLAQPIVDQRLAVQSAALVDLFDRLRREQGPAGRCLLESGGAGPEQGTIRRTMLVLRAWLRLEIRRDRVQVTPLVPGVEPLVRRLEERFGPPLPPPTGLLEDQERLRAPSVLDAVRAAASLVRDRQQTILPPGLFGAFSYEMVEQFESLPERRPDPLDEPDASFVLAGDVAVEDHLTGRVTLITRGLPWEEASAVAARHRQSLEWLAGPRGSGDDPPPRDCPPAEVTSDVSDGQFLASVRRFRDEIGAGEIFQGVLSRGMTIDSEVDPLAVYRELRRRNPSPYMFHLELARGDLIGASPETFLRVEGGQAEIRPIAGTVARGFDRDGGIDADLDGRLALSLQLDHKEQAEHAMLLDLARNDIARIAVPGTTEVVEQFKIEKFSHVQHLVSLVRGTVRPGLDALHVYRAAANMGTLTGAPKVRAMELIREEEPYARGFYGGAAGYLLEDGRFDSCIVIRSLRHRDGRYHTRAGAGLVWDSVAESELAETEKKSLACRVAVAAAMASAGGLA